MGRQSDIVSVAAGALLVVLIVATLYLARGILRPIVISVFFTLILIRAAGWLGTLPGLGVLPTIVRQFLVLAVIAGIGVLLGLLIADMIDRIAVLLPVYGANIEALINTTAARFGIDDVEFWPQIQRGLQESVDLRNLSLLLLGVASSLVASVVLVAIYSGFLLVERGRLALKLTHAIGNEARAERAQTLVLRVSDSMSDYLVAKTLVNIILAVPSYVILYLFGVDFALFWAVLIGLVNYIPYVGSFVGVFLPAMLSLGQFGSIGYTLALTAALSVPQMVVGNVIDPWLTGRRVNLSPLVVVLSLVVWASLWGLTGAILAVPLTAAIVLICAEIPAMRPVAIMLSSGEGLDLPAAGGGLARAGNDKGRP